MRPRFLRFKTIFSKILYLKLLYYKSYIPIFSLLCFCSEATKPSQSLPEVLPRNVVVPTNSGDCLGVPSFPGVKEQLGKMSAGGTTLATAGTDPAEMSRVIAWQNEQLVKLRQQVNQLLTFQQTSDTSGQNLVCSTH